VIREIPPEELLDLAARIEEMTGILLIKRYRTKHFIDSA
jgi:uncharacterized FlaG/YvyC family protein